MLHSANENDHSCFAINLRRPTLSDGAGLWHLTRDTGVLDVNSSYQYLLWCRDFAETSVVGVTEEQQLMGFVTGFLRPDEPTTLMVWQVAVDRAARGRGLASRMLDYLVETTGVKHLETTVTDDNAASQQLFASLAQRHEAEHNVTSLFTPEMYPDEHETEYLHRIGPLVPELVRQRRRKTPQLTVVN
ncbi:MAG TPA: diaminobutyrate acetyltransferase [Enteractinococcus sp.]